MAPDIKLDIDRDRIKTVVREAFRVCRDVLAATFEITEEQFVSSIQPYLDSNRISIPVFLNLPCKEYPGLVLEVNLRRSKVFARIPSHARNHPKQVLLNRYLKVL